MGKRFTEDDKWDHIWFRKLPPLFKLAWLYICDTCNTAGIYARDDELANFKIGAEVDWDEFLESCDGRVLLMPDGKWWNQKYLKRQYPNGLNAKCKPHLSVIRLLESADLLERVTKGFGKGFLTLHEKEKEKEKDKEEEKEKEKEKEVKSEKPKERKLTKFDVFWRVVEPKVARGACEKQFERILKKKLVDNPDPVAYLVKRWQEYATSPVGESEFAWQPLAWLRDGHYDDDDSAWSRVNGKPMFESFPL